MSFDYIHINHKYENIEELINIHNKIDEIQKTLSNNILLNFNVNDVNDVNNINTNIKNVNFYIKNIKSNTEINNNCPICYNYILKDKFKILLCKHVFCGECLHNWSKICIEKSLIITCPLCRKKY
jgi:hypothetical protein